MERAGWHWQVEIGDCRAPVRNIHQFSASPERGIGLDEDGLDCPLNSVVFVVAKDIKPVPHYSLLAWLVTSSYALFERVCQPPSLASDVVNSSLVLFSRIELEDFYEVGWPIIDVNLVDRVGAAVVLIKTDNTRLVISYVATHHFGSAAFPAG